jgi:sugar lactone lactonase YvrE
MKQLKLIIILAVISTIVMVTSGCKKQSKSQYLSLAVVTTLAGPIIESSGSVPDTIASFHYPTGVAVDSAGNVFVADFGDNVIKKISPSGMLTTLAGTGQYGSNNGISTAATFYGPQGVAVDYAAGNVYVADVGYSLIRKISPSGVVSTLAGGGSGNPSSLDGTGTAASFSSPSGVAVDTAGNVYVADTDDNLIRKISPSGVVTTLAGSFYGTSGGIAANLYNPTGVAVDVAGNVYVADEGNNLIRKISPSGIMSILAGNGRSGSANGTGMAASFSRPQGVAVDAGGIVYVADTNNNLIREISPSGAVITLAGNGTQGSANGYGFKASFNYPVGIAVDGQGNVYVADGGNNMIRKISQ